MTARRWRLKLLPRFAGNFLWCGRGFPMLARVLVRGPEGCPARLRLVSFRRTEPSTARERKHRSEGKRGENLHVGLALFGAHRQTLQKGQGAREIFFVGEIEPKRGDGDPVVLFSRIILGDCFKKRLSR